MPDFSETFVSRNPDGSLSVILPDGADIKPVSNTIGTDKSVRWRRSNGALVASVDAYDDPSNQQYISIGSRDPDSFAEAKLYAISDDTTGAASINAAVTDALGNGQVFEIARSDRRSSFMRLRDSPEDRAMAYGSFPVTLSASWATYVVTGLGFFNNCFNVQYNVQVTAGASLAGSEFVSSTNSQFTIDIASTVVQNATINWMAIGN